METWDGVFVFFVYRTKQDRYVLERLELAPDSGLIVSAWGRRMDSLIATE